MRKPMILAVAALGSAVALGTLTAYAQDIIGVSFRPTEVMPPGTASGSADIVAGNGGFLVSADFSGTGDALDMDEFEGATAWVVWAVGMGGDETNVGSLNGDLVMEDSAIDFMPAGLLLSAEAAADADTRDGEVLFEVVLRQTADNGATTDEDEDAATDDAAAEDEAEDMADDAAEDEAPKELPTTGQLVRDLFVLAAVGLVLLLGGLKLRRFAL